MRFYITFFFIIVLSIQANLVFSQQGFSIAGADVNSQDGELNFTIGPLSYHCFSNKNNTISEGLQQPLELQSEFSFDEDNEAKLHCKIYPNPVKDFIYLSIEKYKIENVTYILANESGNTFRTGEITTSKTKFHIKNLLPGTYFLRISYNKSKIETYKIIKQ